jgi:hypothetical protein
MEIGYRIVERFTPALAGWAKYVDWSGLFHLEEVVGLGFDLIEETTCISALTNCGRFEGVFLPTDS